MKAYGEDWDQNDFPLAYLITLRTYGTWLHGDARGSVDMHRGNNRFGTPRIADNAKLERISEGNLAAAAFTFKKEMREVVCEAIREVCRYRGFTLFAVNTLATHAHVVVSGRCEPELIANAFKSYATRKLREKGLLAPNVSPWSRGRSRRYLWKDRNVDEAISYVLYSQGDIKLED
jgi:REP element-mobilizing transposase RayT